MGKSFGKEQGTDFHEHNMWNAAQDECFIFFSITNSCSIALSLFNQTYSVARRGGGEGGIV